MILIELHPNFNNEQLHGDIDPLLQSSVRIDDINEHDVDILVVGAGLSGVVLADLYARLLDKKVLVIDRRDHIAGNCYDFRDPESQILVNKYGAHLFHTNKNRVWKYIHRFSKWIPYEHRVIGRVDGKLVPIPVNIDTVNLLLDQNIRSVEEMSRFMEHERNSASKIDEAHATNSEDIGKIRVGERLFLKLFSEYTKKQWDVYPRELGPEVLARIPVREDWDDRYFPNDAYQALPENGYTDWFQRALKHPFITVLKSTNYFDLRKHPKFAGKTFEKIFFTGQIDQYFHNLGVSLEPLRYRSIHFEQALVEDNSVSQPAFVVNFPQFADGNFTRIAEYKHMYHQTSKQSILIREYSTDTTENVEPYYPFPTPENKAQYEKYRQLAIDEERKKNVYFVGRLANYKYFNMDDAIENALQLFERLQGSKSLDALLESVEMDKQRRMTVHVIASVNSKTALKSFVAWRQKLRQLELQAGGSEVSFKYFVYTTELNLMTFFTTDEKEDGVHVRVGNEYVNFRMSWLEYMLESSFAFGDSNIFLNLESDIVLDDQVVIDGVTDHIALFERQTSRASDEKVRYRDIRTVKVGDVSFDKYRESMVNCTNLQHYIPLEFFKSLGDDETKPEYGENAHFAVTDALLRRTLSVHRTLLYDKFRVWLKRGDLKHSKELGKLWFSLFFSWHEL